MRKTSKLLAIVMTIAMVAALCCTTVFAADTYNVAGAEGLTGANWDPAANQMTDNGDGTYSITFTGIAKGTYEFKIATNGAWDNGEYNLEGDASSGGANASVTVDENDSTVVISFDGEKASVVVNPVADAPADDTPADDGSVETGDTTTVAFVLAALVASMGVAVVAGKKSVRE